VSGVNYTQRALAVCHAHDIPHCLARPCMGFLLDGNTGGANRHDALFTLACFLRDALDNDGAPRKRDDVLATITITAARMGYTPGKARHAARQATQSAYSGQGDGYRYHSPGFRNKPNGKFAAVLGSTCHELGCPQTCPAFRSVATGMPGETFARFEQMGWPKEFRGKAVDVYRVLCALERERGIGKGGLIRTSLRQVAEKTHMSNPRHALRALETHGLIDWKVGSGSGPNAGDRRPSEIRRVVPIPSRLARLKTIERRRSKTPTDAIKEGVARTPVYGCRSDTGESWSLEAELLVLAGCIEWVDVAA
jgi:hypothetical protein